jgi:hypothetical protein
LKNLANVFHHFELQDKDFAASQIHLYLDSENSRS